MTGPEDFRVQEWCPNCDYFFKRLGGNSCMLADWTVVANPDREVIGWLNSHQMDGGECTRIDAGADGCPRFIPYKALAQKYYTDTRHLFAALLRGEGPEVEK